MKIIGFLLVLLALSACGPREVTYHDAVCFAAGEGLTFKADEMREINTHYIDGSLYLTRFERDEISIYRMRPGEVCTISTKTGEVK